MNKFKIIISWILVIIWMICIFDFSNMDSIKSNQTSKETINTVITNTANVTNKVGITNINTKSPKKEKIINTLNLPVRKFAHGFLYLILFILLANLFNVSNFKFRYSFLVILLICFIYALIDEYHQTFIDGRTGQIMDSFIDIGGSVIGLIFTKIIGSARNILNKYKNK